MNKSGVCVFTKPLKLFDIFNLLTIVTITEGVSVVKGAFEETDINLDG
jgi:hypothetical protein